MADNVVVAIGVGFSVAQDMFLKAFEAEERGRAVWRLFDKVWDQEKDETCGSALADAVAEHLGCRVMWFGVEDEQDTFIGFCYDDGREEVSIDGVCVHMAVPLSRLMEDAQKLKELKEKLRGLSLHVGAPKVFPIWSYDQS